MSYFERPLPIALILGSFCVVFAAAHAAAGRAELLRVAALSPGVPGCRPGHEPFLHHVRALFAEREPRLLREHLAKPHRLFRRRRRCSSCSSPGPRQRSCARTIRSSPRICSARCASSISSTWVGRASACSSCSSAAALRGCRRGRGRRRTCSSSGWRCCSGKPSARRPLRRRQGLCRSACCRLERVVRGARRRAPPTRSPQRRLPAASCR